MFYNLVLSIILIICILFQTRLPVCSQSTLTCVDGAASCPSGFVPSCPADITLTPTCLPAFQDVIECCKSVNFNLDCNPAISPACISGQVSSSSGQAGSTSTPFCSSDKIFCTSGGNASCTNLDFELTCVNDFPDCCKTTNSTLDCDTTVLTCEGGSKEESVDFNSIDINVLSGPLFPSSITLPTVPISLQDIAGIAYKGSTASFEITLSEANDEINVIAVDLKDSTDFVFKNASFTITDIADNPERKILTLTIPESIALGEVSFALKFDDSSVSNQNGRIVAFDLPSVTISAGKKGKDKKQILKPVINRVKVSKKKSSRKFSLNITGEEFIGGDYFIEQDNITHFIDVSGNEPDTLIAIFPTTLNPKITERKVSKSGRLFKVKFEIDEPLQKDLNAVVSVSTPAGSTSKVFKIKTGKKGKATLVSNLEVTCFMSKPTCENGEKARCTNSGFKAVCLPGTGNKIPDCCKTEKKEFETSFAEEDIKNLKCNPKLLACPANN